MDRYRRYHYIWAYHLQDCRCLRQEPSVGQWTQRYHLHGMYYTIFDNMRDNLTHISFPLSSASSRSIALVVDGHSTGAQSAKAFPSFSPAAFQSSPPTPPKDRKRVSVEQQSSLCSFSLPSSVPLGLQYHGCTQPRSSHCRFVRKVMPGA